MKVFLVWTVSRSGHHAIVNWIQRQFPGRSIHYNHCFRGWKDQKLIPMHGMINGAREIRNEGDDYLEIYTIEDLNPYMFSENDFASFPILKDNQVTYIWAIRDPYNWLASSILKDGPGAKPDIPHIDEVGNNGRRIDTLKAQIDEYEKRTNHIPFPIEIANFNKWFLDEHYREHLSKILDIPFTDEGMNEVSHFGGGSTFDSMQYQGRAQQMKVLNRWELLKDSERFKQCLEPELIEFSRKYFDFVPMLP